MTEADAHSRLSRISASPEALKALKRVRETHGDVMFHITRGCCDARSPLCLRVGDLRLGARDKLIGFADSAPVYEMVAGVEDRSSRAYVLDVLPGTSVGFSLEAGSGVRFTIREISGSGASRLIPPNTPTTGVST